MTSRSLARSTGGASTPKRSPSHGGAGLQFGLQFTAVAGCSRKTGDGRWSSWDGPERWSPELLMRFGLRRLRHWDRAFMIRNMRGMIFMI